MTHRTGIKSTNLAYHDRMCNFLNMISVSHYKSFLKQSQIGCCSQDWSDVVATKTGALTFFVILLPNQAHTCHYYLINIVKICGGYVDNNSVLIGVLCSERIQQSSNRMVFQNGWYFTTGIVNMISWNIPTNVCATVWSLQRELFCQERRFDLFQRCYVRRKMSCI